MTTLSRLEYRIYAPTCTKVFKRHLFCWKTVIHINLYYTPLPLNLAVISNMSNFIILLRWLWIFKSLPVTDVYYYKIPLLRQWLWKGNPDAINWISKELWETRKSPSTRTSLSFIWSEKEPFFPLCIFNLLLFSLLNISMTLRRESRKMTFSIWTPWHATFFAQQHLVRDEECKIERKHF